MDLCHRKLLRTFDVCIIALDNSLIIKERRLPRIYFFLTDACFLWGIFGVTLPLRSLVTCSKRLHGGCSKTAKAQRGRLCQSLVLETLLCISIKAALHRWDFPRNVPTFLWLSNLTPLNNWLERGSVNFFSKPNQDCFSRATAKV